MTTRQIVLREMMNHHIPEMFGKHNHALFSQPLVEELRKQGINCRACRGISKLAIVVEDLDIVFKLPFRGQFEEYSFDSAEYHYGAEETKTAPNEEDYWEEFSGGMEIEPNGARWNYCALEASLYHDAKEAGLAQYFAREIYIGEVDNHPVYEQDKASILEDMPEKDYPYARREKTEEKCDSLGIDCFCPVWIEDFLDEYGVEEYRRLEKFLNEKHICDLHDGNLGYINGKPVLVDYTGYNEW